MLLKDKVSKDIAARTPRWVGMSGVTPRSSLPGHMAVGVVVAELLDAYNCVHGQTQIPRVFILSFPAPFPGTFCLSVLSSRRFQPFSIAGFNTNP